MAEARKVKIVEAGLMSSALGLAARGLGKVWPNPSVGCVLVAESGRVISRGWTQVGGQPHAETEALMRAGSTAKGATAYVTLEPCSHHGNTSPCAEALLDAAITRVVVALEDPDPRVAGRGIALLREAGIEVDIGLCARAAHELNAGFFSRISKGRPLVTLKTATTLDGRIAIKSGESRWITSQVARDRAHLLRSMHDAVMVGIGTALVDDPELTCRLPGFDGRSPHRILVDSRLRIPTSHKIVRTASEVPTWIIHLETADRARGKALEDFGVRMIPTAAAGNRPDMQLALNKLGDRGFTRILVEGGGDLSATLIKGRLIDRLVWFRAPSIIGGDGLPMAGSLGVERLDEVRHFRPISIEAMGDDVLEIYALEE